MPLAGVATAQQSQEHGDRAKAEWGRGDRGGRRFDPVGRILELKGELGLSDDQVSALTRIQTKYADQNRPLIERLRAERGDSGEARGRDRADRKAWVEAHPEAAKAMKELRENGKAMRKEVHEVLTEDQRTKLEQRWGKDHKGRHGAEDHGRND